MESEEVPILNSDHHQQDIEMSMVSKGNEVISMAPQLYCDSVCDFFQQENISLESQERSKSAKKLCGLIICYLLATAVEIVGGIKANSLAVIADAAHLLMDVAGVSISLFTVWASGWDATSQHSFGFNRLEVLGALISVQLIWVISGILIYEAVVRILYKDAEVDGEIMFGVAAFGFIINLFMVTFIGHDHGHHACGGHGHHTHGHDHSHAHGHDHSHAHGHDHSHSHARANGHDQEGENLCAVTEEGGSNLVSCSSPVKTKILNINLQGAYLHVLADLIQSVGVMIAASVMWVRPDWYVVDLICTFLFSAFALSATIPMLRNIFGILMMSTPTDINVAKLETDLKCIKGVRDIHDLHVWAITLGKVVLSCHVIAEPGASSSEILHKIRDYCKNTHRINNVTVQIE